MTRIATLLALSLACCKPYARPTYDDACRPSDPWALDMAASREDWPAVDLPAEPEQALAVLLSEVERAGWRVVTKPDGAPAEGFSTTLPGVLALSRTFADKPPEDQAATMGHELVHVRQWQRLGPSGFLRLYAVPEGRLALEGAAYGYGYSVFRHVGGVPLPEDYEARVGRLWDAYEMDAVPACVQAAIVEIWTRG